MIITTPEQLRETVTDYMRRDEFVFDLETTYDPEPDEVEYNAALRAKSPKVRTVDEKAWLEEFDKRATDEVLNRVIWVGLATAGRSDAVASGHPNGAMLKPARQEKIPVLQAFPEGDRRRLTKTGKLSMARVPRMVPAEFAPPPPQLDISTACEILEPLMFSDRRKINQNLGFDIKTISKYFDWTLPSPPWGELQVALHILDENGYMAWDLENFVRVRFEHRYKKLAKTGVTNYSFLTAGRYAEQDARFTWLLWSNARRRLQEDPILWELFEFEMEVSQPLRAQEIHGMKVDRTAMGKLRTEYEDKADLLRQQLIVDYGVRQDYNPNSNPHKIELLYDKLHARKVDEERTDTGQLSVASTTLERIKGDGGRAAGAATLMIEHAELLKDIGSFFVGIGSKLNERDYLHPSFSQHSAATGRLASYAPSVHQISRDSDIRGMFIADRGEVLISVDWDQIELRFICTYAEDETMRDLFHTDEDIHTATASLLFRSLGKDPAEMTGDDRVIYGKNVNFCMSYGGGPYRLHLMTGIDVDEAGEILDTYFRRFNKINPWKQREINTAKARAEWGQIDGSRKMIYPPYVETMLGRRRRLPELFINPRRARTKEEYKLLRGRLLGAERQAINAIVQGSAADTMKIATVDIHKYVQETKFPLQMIATIHDEIVAVCPQNYAEDGLKLMIDRMENVVNPRTGEPPLGDWVPLVASGKIGERWQKD